MNRRQTSRVLVSGLAAMFTLSACSGSAGGHPTPEDPPQSNTAPSQASTSNEPDHTAAPTVHNPLDVSDLKDDPCTALSDPQQDKLHLRTGTEKKGKIGPYCIYKYANDSENSVSVGISKPLRGGLADVYAKQEALGRFEPTTIAGYPAAYASPYQDRSDQGECQLYVGLTDTDAARLTVYLYEGTHDYSRPCDVADLTAKTVIQHLKDGS